MGRWDGGDDGVDDVGGGVDGEAGDAVQRVPLLLLRALHRHQPRGTSPG